MNASCFFPLRRSRGTPMKLSSCTTACTSTFAFAVAFCYRSLASLFNLLSSSLTSLTWDIFLEIWVMDETRGVSFLKWGVDKERRSPPHILIIAITYVPTLLISRSGPIFLHLSSLICYHPSLDRRRYIHFLVFNVLI